MNDTIAAISTAPGVGAISIIRISGELSIDIVSKIFKGKNLKNVDSHTIHYGHIVDQDIIIDEVLISIMKAPKTFTREDIVEINCHGGIVSTEKILELLLISGCRLADPGEFTKRAFLNGRIDLLEAEGIMDMIEAKTEQARQMAMNQIDGNVSSLINDVREQLVQILTNISVNIDYPEYEDVEEITISKLLPFLNSLRNSIEKILKESENGKKIKEGITTSIIGKPNVGKSSLLNILLQEEKAIVTDIEGTTRDCVEGDIQIEGIIFHLIDTAGIRQTEDIVEKIGVKKSLELLEKSDLVLMVLNYNEILSKEEQDLLEQIKNKTHLVIINKVELDCQLDRNLLKDHTVIEISATQQIGIDVIKLKMKELFQLDKLKTSDFNYITNARALSLLKKSLQCLNDIEKAINDKLPIDMIELDLNEIWNLLGSITGSTYEEELLDELFQRFCVGK